MFVVCTQVLWAKQREGRWVIWYRQRQVISKGWLVPVAKEEVALIKGANYKYKTEKSDFQLSVCFGVVLLCFVIGLKNARHLLNQSDAGSNAFSRAWRRSRVFVSSSHWLVVLFPLLWLALVISLVLALPHSIEDRSTEILIMKYMTINLFWYLNSVLVMIVCKRTRILFCFVFLFACRESVK